MNTRAILAGLSALLVITACASTGSTRTDGRRDRLTREQILELDVSTLYDVVQRLRPRWLMGSGGEPVGSMGNAAVSVVVYQNQAFMGGPEVLRQFSPDVAAELRYLDGPTASATLPGLGSQHVSGAIIIRTRR